MDYPGSTLSLSVRAGIGASTAPIPETTMDVEVTPSTIIVNWTGPGLLERSCDLGLMDLWLRDNSNDALSPPRTLFRSQLGQTDSFFFRMATPWNVVTQP